LSLVERPEPHPQPEKINFVNLPIYRFTQGVELLRIHKSQRGAIYFDRSNGSRFNAPTGEYGVLYTALDSFAAFRETYRLDRFTPIGRDFLAQRCISVLTAQRDLKLVNLVGAELTHIGADARLTTGSYSLTQPWSKALYSHIDLVDGLYYRSRFDPSRFCVALYENRVAIDILQERKVTDSNLLDPSFEMELQQILKEYQYELDDDQPI
jgi:RES domain